MTECGVDAQTGEIWLAEDVAPIRPLMTLEEFLESFEPLDAFRTDVAQNPFPTCGFGRTFRNGDQHFTVAGQFSDSRPTCTPQLRIVRLFATRSAWSRKKAGVLLRLRRMFSSNPMLIGLARGYHTMEQQLAVYESWMSASVGQAKHEQAYSWGHLKLMNSRNECYHLQFEFAK